MTARLASASQGVRDAEIETLLAIGEPAIPVLYRICNSRNPLDVAARESAVLAIGRIGGDTATDALIKILKQVDEESTRRLWFRIPMYFLLALLTIALTSIFLFVLKGYFMESVVAGAGAAFSALKAKDYRKKVVESLGRVQDPRSVAALASVRDHADLQPFVDPLLARLLPETQEEDIRRFTKEDKQAIAALMETRNAGLVRGAIHVVGMFGMEAELSTLRRLRARHQDLLGQIVDAERQIEARLAMLKEKNTLLRAASAGETDFDSLLRPSAALPDPAPEQLLRPEE